MHSYRRDLTLLRERQFTMLLGARTVSVLGASFAPVALAFGVLGLPGATARTLSVVLTAQGVPMVAFMLIGGVIADRLPRRFVMLTGEILNALAYLALGLMMLSGWTPLPALAAAAAVTGICVALYFPAMTGLVPELVPAHRLQAANGLIGLGANSSRVLGTVAGGTSVVLLGPGWALFMSATLFAIAAAFIALLSPRTPGPARPSRATASQMPGDTPPAQAVPAQTVAGQAAFGHTAREEAVNRQAVASARRRQSVVADLREGWQIFISKQWLWVVVAQFAVLVMALQAAHGVLGPVVAKEELGGAAAWSAALAAETLGMIAGVVIAMRLRPRRPILLATLMMLGTALPYAALGLSAPLWTVAVAFFVMGICFDIFGVLWQTTMQREIPAESLSRVSSYDALGSLMFGPIGLIIAGPVAVAIGPKPALLGCAAIVVLSTLAALLSPGVRNLTAPADQTVTPETQALATAPVA